MRALVASALLACTSGTDDPEPPARTASAVLAAPRWTVVAATASSGNAGLAIDGNEGTRWESAFSDPQWIRFDLGSQRALARLVIRWETASSRDYTVEGSNDGNAWTVLVTRTAQPTGARVDDVPLSGNHRFVRIHGTARTTVWGHSIWEVELYGPDEAPAPGSRWPISAVTASSVEFGTPAEAADGNMGTRWSSLFTDPQWIRFDLGVARAIGRVVIHWEAASARDYTVQGSSDGNAWTTLATRTGMAAGARNDDVGGLSGTYRYVRVHGTARTSGYGYSIWEIEIEGPGGSPPNPGGPFALNLSVPTVEYLEIELVPPSREGRSLFIIQNNTLSTQVTYAAGTQVTVNKRQSSTFGREVFFREGQTTTLPPLSVLMNQDRTVSVVLVPIGGGDSPVYTDPIEFPEAAPRPGAFALTSPAHNAVHTQDRRPILRWPAVAGASSYRVFLNVTREDYDFTQPGPLLERYTLIGTTTQTSLQSDSLPDRWTYRWFVEAVTGGSTQRSENRAFAVYLPVLERVDDGVAIVGNARDLNKSGAIEPYEDWTRPIESRIDDLISRMTATEKAMQLFFVAERFPTAGWHFGPARAEDLFEFQRGAARTRLGIPFVSAGDTTHGYVTSYPIGVGMAATRDPALVYEAARMQRREHLVAGYRGTLGPIAEVGTKAIYPRIQEGGGEDADLVAAIIRAMVAGYQGGPELNPASVMPTTKHWPGEGAGGEAGIVYDGVTIKYHMKPFRGALEAGTGAVMPGYAGSNFLDPGGRGAGDSIGILAYLREVMDYDGLIMTDWLPSGAWIRAANAGSDVMGGADPSNIDMNAFIAGVDPGRLNRALRRILRVKFKLGIFENPYGDLTMVASVHHSPENVALARRAAEASLTLLKNTSLLPLRLPVGARLLVTGPRATDGEAMAIWRSAFQPLLGEKTIAQAIAERGQQAGLTVVVDSSLAPANQGYAAAIAVVGERSYTHGTFWDKESPFLPPEERGLLTHLAGLGIPFALVYLMPRPYIIGGELPQANAVLVAYRPGGSGGPAIARLLFGDIKPKGKLPFQLPRDMAQVGNDRYPEIGEKWDIPFDLGASAAQRQQIRNLIDAGQPVPPTTGDPLFQYGAGFTGFNLSDSSPPTAPAITAPTAGQLLRQAPVFTWTAAQDPQTGIQLYEVVVDGVVRATTTQTSLAGKPLQLSSGSHQVIVRARNWAEQTTASPTVSFQFADIAAPTQPVVVAAASLGGGQARVTWLSAGDAESGILQYVVRANGAAIATIAAEDRQVTYRNVALGSAATASSRQGDLFAGNAVDGNAATRWGSESLDNQWIRLDLGGLFNLDRVNPIWETAYARRYLVETSVDGQQWTPSLTVDASPGGTESRVVSVAAARHVRLTGLERATAFGISLWELGLMGRPAEQAVVTASAPASLTVEAVDRHGNRTTSPAFAF